MLRRIGACTALLVTTACSGATDDTAGTAPSSDVDSVATMATLATSTTAAPAPSQPLSTEPPPTAPPASTPSPEDQVRAAYELRYRGYWECLRQPLNCDTSYLLEGSGSAEGLHATMQALADRDRYVGADDVGYYVIESIDFVDGGATALVTACWWSTAVLYGAPIDPNRPAGPDNAPTIVNNTPGSILILDTMRTDSSSDWKLAGSRSQSEKPEVNECS